MLARGRGCAMQGCFVAVPGKYIGASYAGDVMDSVENGWVMRAQSCAMKAAMLVSGSTWNLKPGVASRLCGTIQSGSQVSSGSARLLGKKVKPVKSSDGVEWEGLGRKESDAHEVVGRRL
jgi:hypothetical protein